LKRATRTPNRFITSTRSWPVKGFALFLILLALGSCEDEQGLIGSKRPTSRFAVYFKEFAIPVTTIQADSIPSTVKESQRLLCGNATDVNFGDISANMNLQFFPSLASSNPKIDVADKTNFTPVSLTFNLILDYYVFGDTADAIQNFSLHEISPTADFWRGNEYFTTSTVSYDNDAIASASFQYKHDSIVDHRTRNRDTNSKNNRYDTIKFSLPIEYAQHLLDTATAKGVYSTNEVSGVWELDIIKTDSVFRKAFPGLTLVPGIGNKNILGFQINSSSMNLAYTYVRAGSTINSNIVYTAYGYPSFSSFTSDRTGTALQNLSLSNKYQDYNSPDDFCYLQSGTGLFAKLDFRGVHSYFDAEPDTILNMALNAAEIIIDAEPDADRHHLSTPVVMYFRVVKQNNRFFKAPILANGDYDPQFATAYYCLSGSSNLDALSDNVREGAVPLLYSKSATTNRQEYKAYVTDFFQNFLRLPEGYDKIYYMGLLPGDANYGKSLHGLSFKKDKVKLRVYYTKTL
jgi:hypothetical protein